MNVTNARLRHLVDRDAARDGEQGRRQIVDQWDADGPNVKETLNELKASLEQLTSALLQTRFQTDASSRSVTRAVSRLRGTLMVCTVVLSLVIIAATLPRFVPITPVGRTWMLWHQVGGTWDPLSAWPTREACEAAAPRVRQAELSYRCLPDSVDPRGPKGK